MKRILGMVAYILLLTVGLRLAISGNGTFVGGLGVFLVGVFAAFVYGDLHPRTGNRGD